MSLSWPWALLALLAVPLLFGFRWWMRRRRRRVAVRMPSIALIRAALPVRSHWRRRIPVALFVAGLVVLGAGVTRPQASVEVSRNATTIILAIDVSGSMCSTDVAPNRLTVAQDAARAFIEAQDDGTRIGLVAFSSIAGLLVAPTTEQDDLLDAIDSLTTSRGTAIGLAILASIDAIAEINPDVAPTGVELPVSPDPAPDPPVDFEPDTIVVLTDGANSQGVEPTVAAEQAAARHLRVYTIGFGTTEPAQLVCSPNQISGDSALGGDRGFGGGGGGGRLRLIDEPTLMSVADQTGGEYFRAQDAESLTDVLLGLPESIVVQREDMELTSWFALAGALFVLGAVGLSLWWNRSTSLPARPPGPGQPDASRRAL